MEEIVTLNGNIYYDIRGSVKFVNDFNPFNEGIKRFYIVNNIDTDVIRAWHGHLKANTYVHVISGSIILAWAKLVPHDEETTNQSKRGCKFREHKDHKDDFYFDYIESVPLFAAYPKVVKIPPMHANGFRALEPNTNVIFFSDFTLQECIDQKEDVRFPWKKTTLLQSDDPFIVDRNF